MYNKSIKEGLNSEIFFYNVATKKGFVVKESSKYENINKHIDFHITKNNKTFSVDVKAKKRIKRNDHKGNSEFIWIELNNVKGNNGWIFGSQDLIAFEQENEYIIVNRNSLKNLVLKLLEENKLNNQNQYGLIFVNNSNEALYNHYQRRNRQDIITLIKKSDLFNIDYRIWKK